jgi:hypothetical protein
MWRVDWVEYDGLPMWCQRDGWDILGAKEFAHRLPPSLGARVRWVRPQAGRARRGPLALRELAPARAWLVDARRVYE